MDERGAVRVGGEAAHPGDTERLHEYWVHGDGAAKIRWGEPDDFARCVEHLGKYIRDPQGYCNLAHKAATGMYPAQHAAELKAGRTDADGHALYVLRSRELREAVGLTW